MDDTVSVGQSKENITEYLNRAAHGRERIVVASRGRPLAAAIGLEDLQLLEELEDVLVVREAQAQYKRGGSISLAQRIALLVRAGLLVWSGQRLAPRPPLAGMQGSRKVADLLLEDRA
jgi:prevent-host-death family protein